LPFCVHAFPVILAIFTTNVFLKLFVAILSMPAIYLVRGTKPSS